MELSPSTATVLGRLLRDGSISERRCSNRDLLRLKLLEQKGLATRSAPDVWVATELAGSVDVSHAAPDNYEVVKQIGLARPFRARRDGRLGLFEAAEHVNIGRGWMIRDLESDELISEGDLTDIEPSTGFVAREGRTHGFRN